MTRTAKSFFARLIGTIAVAAALLTTAGAKELETRQVQISELVSDGRAFAGLRVTVTGVLQPGPDSSPLAPSFVLVDNSGNTIPVTTWAPLEIPPFMPGYSTATSVPKTMRDYVGRKLSLTGDYRLRMDNTFQIVTDSALDSVSPTGEIAAAVLPRAARSQTTLTPVNGAGVSQVPVFKSGAPVSARTKG